MQLLKRKLINIWVKQIKVVLKFKFYLLQKEKKLE